MVSKEPVVSASILAADFWDLGRAVEEARAGGAARVHVDVMDGHFVPNLSIGVPIIKAVRARGDYFVEVHLMVDNPEHLVEMFIDAGANLITVHAEVAPHLHRLISRIKARSVRAGVALNPSSPVALVSEVLEFLDHVLVMTVNPGFAGQTFLPFTMRKVKQLRELRERLGYSYEIGVDGGINPETGPIARQAGADVFVAASAIFQSESIADAVQQLKVALDLAESGTTT